MAEQDGDRLGAVEGVLDHRFADRALLREALTHSSATVGSTRRRRSNERLEFLGDRVLGLVVADLLIRSYPNEPEGALSRRHDRLVRKETLAEVAQELDLGPQLQLARGEQESGGRGKSNILADACEALLGALFLDGGLAAAAPVIERHWTARIAALREAPRDSKMALQEWAQARGLELPRYEAVTIKGPAHAPRFVVTVSLDGLESRRGEGSSKRAAEKEAARHMLEQVIGT